MFLQLNSNEFDNYIIYLDWRLSSDHTPLTVKIFILKEHIQTVKIVDDGLDFYFHSSFFYFFSFSFIFLFLEQLGLGSIGHAVTPVTSDGIVTGSITR